jgi:hypothetical protein
MFDWIGYILVAYGPYKITTNPYTRFGRWCLSHAGGWAYRFERREYEATLPTKGKTQE